MVHMTTAVAGGILLALLILSILPSLIIAFATLIRWALTIALVIVFFKIMGWHH